MNIHVQDEDNTKLYQQILECKLEFPFNHSQECLDLIKRLLCRDPEKRITLPEILQHNFYKNGKFELEEMKIESQFDAETVSNLAVSKMIKLGFQKELIFQNLKKNEFNNLSAAYFLLQSQFKAEKSSNRNELPSSVLNSLPNSVSNKFQNGFLIKKKVSLKTDINSI